MKQCAVLFVNPGGEPSVHPCSLQEMGFIVEESRGWPDDGAVRNYHAVVVRVPTLHDAPMLAARLRAKPHFGRRLLLALVHPLSMMADRRAAEAAGFDQVLDECCAPRQLAMRILRGLKDRPELRCVLPRVSPGRWVA